MVSWHQPSSFHPCRTNRDPWRLTPCWASSWCNELDARCAEAVWDCTCGFFSGESTPSVHFSGKSEATISWCSLFAFYPSQTIFGGPLVVLENTTKYFKSKRKKSLEHPLHERWVSNPNLVLLLQASISIISFGKARVSTTTSLCEKHPKILQDHLRSSKCKPLMIYHSQFL